MVDLRVGAGGGRRHSIRDPAGLANAFGILSQLYADPDSNPAMYRGSYKNRQDGGTVSRIWIRTGKKSSRREVGWVEMTFTAGRLAAMQSSIAPRAMGAIPKRGR